MGARSEALDTTVLPRRARVNYGLKHNSPTCSSLLHSIGGLGLPALVIAYIW